MAYSYSCVAGAAGLGGSLVNSSVSGSWTWAGGMQPSCLMCSAGSYVSLNGSSCVACPTGMSTSSSVSTSISSCAICVPGYAGSVAHPGTANASGCIPCPTGVYATGSGTASYSSCSLCAPGYAGRVTNSGTPNGAGCAICALGSYSIPIRCKAGVKVMPSGVQHTSTPCGRNSAQSPSAKVC